MSNVIAEANWKFHWRLTESAGIMVYLADYKGWRVLWEGSLPYVTVDHQRQTLEVDSEAAESHTHQLAMKVSDSVWHSQLSQTARQTGSGDSPYWLVPFTNYKTFCPYLVGSYDTVGRELARYLRIGCRTIITDVPFDETEMRHTDLALGRGLAQVPV